MIFPKLKFRAWYRGDINRGMPLKFTQEYDEENSRLVFQHDEQLYYNFEIPFIDDDWILEQSTGVMDKNGVEIFEGDYIYRGFNQYNTWYYKKIRIVGRQTLFCINLDDRSFCEIYHGCGSTYSERTLKGSTVIGNIYQPPNIVDSVNVVVPFGDNEELVL